MKPIYVTKTPNMYRIQFEYHPKLVEVIKMIPSKPRYDGTDRAWLVSISNPNYPVGRDAYWYVGRFAQWAVHNRLCSDIRYREVTEDINYDLPVMKPFEGEHYMLLEPYQYQLEGVRYAIDSKRCIFGDQPGLGKLQSYNSLIATPYGFVKMGTLKVGDELFGRDGNVYQVEAIYEHGMKELYRVTFSDGVSTLAGMEHLWNVRDTNRRRRNRGWVIKTTEELIAAGITEKLSPSRQKSNRSAVLKWEIPMCDPVMYSHKDFFIHPYIMGVLIGDGNVCNGRVVFSNPDFDGDIHKKVSSLLPDSMQMVRECFASCPRYAIVNSDNKHENRFLSVIKKMRLNIKSIDKFIPLEYLRGDVEQRIELLRGLMDTDGSITSGRLRMTYHSMSYRLCEDIAELVRSLGGQAIIRKYDRGKKGIEYQVNVRLKINPFSTHRKAKRYKINKSNYCSRYIQSIEFECVDLCRCIKVSAPDALYLTDDYIVTHNTLQAICTVVKAHKESAIYGESFPALVICPAALKVNWQREFKKFAGLNAIILDDSNRQTWQSFYECKKADGTPLCEVFITNYESLKKYFVKAVVEGSKLTMKNILFDERIKLFNSVIIDESHKCKSGKTQQGKFVEGICKGKRFILELTGTPVVNNNTDLIQQLKILGRLEDFGGYSRFVEKYCDGPKQASNVKELNWRLWNTCFFRREKSKVLTQLPDKTRQFIQVDITTEKEYRNAEADVVKYLKQYKNASDAQVQRSLNGAMMVRMGLLKQISARGKIKAVSEFIHDVIDGGEKLIVFAYLKDVIAQLKKEFPKAVTVTGSDNINQKQYAVDSFQNNPDCNLIILNYKSGGTGLTLTASSRVLFIEFPWTFSDCEQAEDRAHRNGQKNNVNCYYFLGKNTIDKYMYDVIQTKKNIANGVTGTDDQVAESMVNLAMDLFRDKL